MFPLLKGMVAIPFWKDEYSFIFKMFSFSDMITKSYWHTGVSTEKTDINKRNKQKNYILCGLHNKNWQQLNLAIGSLEGRLSF